MESLSTASHRGGQSAAHPIDQLCLLLSTGLTARTRAWLLSADGLTAACRDAVRLGDGALLGSLDDDRLWSQLEDLSPYPAGNRLVSRGRAIVAAARLALWRGDDADPARIWLAQVAAGFGEADPVGVVSGPTPTGARSGLDLVGAYRQRAPSSALTMAADMVRWLSGAQPEPLSRPHRVTFLIDQHLLGRVARLTVVERPGPPGVALDVTVTPFTLADGAFMDAVEDAYWAVGDPSLSVRWFVTWETGESIEEVEGPSVGLAAAVALHSMVSPATVEVRGTWAFTGAVGRDGAVAGLRTGEGDGPYVNKLRAAGRRNIVIPAADLAAASQLAEAAALPVRVHGAGSLDEVVALLSKRQPAWVVADDTSIVGRTGSVAGLLAAFEAARAARAPVVVVAGEPGIGKSRLVRELGTRVAGDGAMVGWGRCYEEEATLAYRPVVACLQSLMRLMDDDLDAVIGSDRPALAILLPELAAGDAADHDPGARSEQQLYVFDAVARFVTRAAELAPVVLVIEDVHWADQPSLLLLGHLARHSADAQVLLVVTYRDNEIGPEHRLTGWLSGLRSARPVRQVELAGLGPEQIDEMMAALNGRPAPEAFGAAVAAATNGNPLFIRELTQHAKDLGLLDPARDRWQLATDTDHLPDGVREVLVRRVTRLSADCRPLLTMLAASPGGASFELLGVGTPNKLAVLEALDEAVIAGVVHERQAGQDRVFYEFSHALFRQVLYGALTPSRRARIHWAVAGQLEQVVDPDDERWVGDLAYHYYLAGRIGNPAAALRHCRQAGDVAMARTAYHDAVAHYTRAVEAADWVRSVDDGELAALQLRLAAAHFRAGSPGARREAAEAAFERARKAGAVATMAEAALVHGGARSTYGVASERTTAMLSEAVAAAAADATVDRGLLARVMSRLSQETYHVQQFQQAKTLSAQAVALAEQLADPAVLAATYDGRAWTLNTPDDVHQRLALAHDMVGQATLAHEPEWETMGRIWRCSARLQLGDMAGIDADLARLGTLAAEAPVPSHLFRISTMRTTRAMMTGAYPQGLALAQETFDIGRTAEPDNAEQTFQAQLIGMLREQAGLGGLVPMAEQLAAGYAAVPGWQCALAFLYAEADRADQARAVFEQLAADRFASVPRDLAWLQAQSYLAEVAAYLGDPDPAAIIFDLLVPFAHHNVGLFDIASNGAVAHYLGLLAVTLERGQQALGYLRAAVAFNDTTGQRPAAARSRFEYARLLAHGDRHDRATATGLLTQAITVARDLGLTRLSAQIAPLAAELGL